MIRISRKRMLETFMLVWTIAVFLPVSNVLAMTDGEYSVSADLFGGSGKAAVTSPTLLTVKNGQPTARIQWSSANYDYMIVDGIRYDNLSEEGMNSVFEIPVLCWNERMDVIADTVAMGKPIEIQYELIFYEDSLGDKGELPQEATKRVLIMAAGIMTVGGVLNHFIKKRAGI